MAARAIGIARCRQPGSHAHPVRAPPLRRPTRPLSSGGGGDRGHRACPTGGDVQASRATAALAARPGIGRAVAARCPSPIPAGIRIWAGYQAIAENGPHRFGRRRDACCQRSHGPPHGCAKHLLRLPAPPSARGLRAGGVVLCAPRRVAPSCRSVEAEWHRSGYAGPGEGSKDVGAGIAAQAGRTADRW